VADDAVHDGEDGAALDPAAQEGGVAGAAREVGLADGPGGGGVDEGEVGGAVLGEGTKAQGVQAAESGGLDGHEADEAIPGDGAGVDEGLGVEGECGLEADQAEGGVLKGKGLFVGGVRGVVGGEVGDGAVGDALDEGGGVGLFAEGRVDLGGGVVVVAGVVGDGGNPRR
jgi:hypothetical protein